MVQEEVGGIDITYNEKQPPVAYNVQLEVLVEKNMDNIEVYSVKESALYALGDLSMDPNSETYVYVKMEDLKKLIEYYEQRNPGMVVEIVRVSMQDFLEGKKGEDTNMDNKEEVGMDGKSFGYTENNFDKPHKL